MYWVIGPLKTRGTGLSRIRNKERKNLFDSAVNYEIIKTRQHNIQQFHFPALTGKIYGLR